MFDCILRQYYTFRWVCILVTSNVPKRKKKRNWPQIPNLSLPYHKSYKSSIYQMIMSEIEATLCLPQKYS